MLLRVSLTRRISVWPSSKEATKAVGRCKRPGDVVKILKAAEAAQLTDGVLCAAALHRLGAIEKRSEGPEVGLAWKFASQRAAEHLASFGTRELAVAALATAKARRRTETKVHFLEKLLAKADLPAFPLRHLANLLWAAAALRADAAPLFASATQAVSNGEPNARDASQLLWAFATARKSGQELLEDVAQRNLQGFSDHDMATTVWAVATMSCAGPRGQAFVGDLAVAACARTEEFAPQGLSMLLWGYATLAQSQTIPAAQLVTSLCPKVAKDAKLFTPQGAANILWALATLDASMTESEAESAESKAGAGVTAFEEGVWAIEALSASLSEQLLACNGQDIANALWALASLGYDGTAPAALFQKVSSCSADLAIYQFTAQNCANILWAFARRGRESGSRDLALAIAERAALLSHEWDEQSLATTVWALAVLGQRPASLPLLTSVTEERLGNFSVSSLCVLVWTCGMLGVADHPTLLLAVLLRKKSRDLTTSQLLATARAFASIWPTYAMPRLTANFHESIHRHERPKE
ncbi:unnamed protein product [Effrenium voratum]|uniref:Uncharacterized protein n=1 Tax=Effrenium voratum TaxID=2562239 RepID=A0AA36MPZ2_9DINO|nr:unnamed protein product [Effrenium voratum]